MNARSKSLPSCSLWSRQCISSRVASQANQSTSPTKNEMRAWLVWSDSLRCTTTEKRSIETGFTLPRNLQEQRIKYGINTPKRNTTSYFYKIHSSLSSRDGVCQFLWWFRLQPTPPTNTTNQHPTKQHGSWKQCRLRSTHHHLQSRRKIVPSWWVDEWRCVNYRRRAKEH